MDGKVRVEGVGGVEAVGNVGWAVVGKAGWDKWEG